MKQHVASPFPLSKSLAAKMLTTPNKTSAKGTVRAASKSTSKATPKPKVSHPHSPSVEVIDKLNIPVVVKKAPKKPKLANCNKSEGEQIVKKRMGKL